MVCMLPPFVALHVQGVVVRTDRKQGPSTAFCRVDLYHTNAVSATSVGHRVTHLSAPTSTSGMYKALWFVTAL